MIDVQQVHDVLEGKTGGRQCGKTTAMLVTALGYADFSYDNEPRFSKPIAILCGDYNMAKWTLHRFIELAMEMEFEVIDHFKRLQVIVNHRRYSFAVRNQSACPPDGFGGQKCFVDTFNEFSEIN